MAKINLGKVVPEKGVDYFTDAEIAQFKADVEADLDSRLDTDEANITTNANNISDNTSAISALGTRMTTAEGNITTNAGNISSIGNRVTTLESDMTTAKNNIQTNAGDIDTLEQQQAIQDAAIEANTTALAGLANIPGKVTALETNDALQDTKIANLEEECESLRHDLNKATLDATDTPSDNITLQDTVQAQLKKFALDGKTEQFTTNGKQLFDIDNFTDSAGSTTQSIGKGEKLPTGFRLTKTDSGANGRFTNPISCNLSAGTYKLSGIRQNSTLTNSHGLGCRLRNSNSYTVLIEYIGNGEQLKEFTLEQDVNEIQFYMSSDEALNTTVEFVDIMILKSTETDYTYEPYTGGIPSPNPNYKQEIKNVEGEIINIFDKSRTPDLNVYSSVSELSTGIRVTSTANGTYHEARYILGSAQELNGKTIRISSNVKKYVDSGQIRLLSCDQSLNNPTQLISLVSNRKTIFRI